MSKSKYAVWLPSKRKPIYTDASSPLKALSNGCWEAGEMRNFKKYKQEGVEHFVKRVDPNPQKELPFNYS